MDNRLLTLGQAALLVLSDRVNKPGSKEIWVEATHNSTDELESVASYLKTPPSSDTLSCAKVPNDEEILFKDDILFDGSLSDEEMIFDDYDNKSVFSYVNPDNNAENESSESINHEDINGNRFFLKEECHNNYTLFFFDMLDRPIVPKKKMLSFAKMIFSLHKPHPFRHDYMFITPDLQYGIITSHLNIGSINVSSLSSIINKDDFISFMYIYKGAKGRWLYVLREPHRGKICILVTTLEIKSVQLKR